MPRVIPGAVRVCLLTSPPKISSSPSGPPTDDVRTILGFLTPFTLVRILPLTYTHTLKLLFRVGWTLHPVLLCLRLPAGPTVQTAQAASQPVLLRASNLSAAKLKKRVCVFVLLPSLPLTGSDTCPTRKRALLTALFIL